MSFLFGKRKTPAVGWWFRHRNEPLYDWPLLGHFPQLLANLHRFHQWCTTVAATSHGTFLFKGPILSNMDMIFTVDPINIKHIMINDFSNYPKGPYFKEMFQVLGDGILNADFDTWRFQRKAANSVFKHDQFRSLVVKTITLKVETKLFPLVEHICEKGLHVDLQDLIHKFTMDTAYKMITGYDPQYLNKEFKKVEFILGMDYVEEAIFYRHARPRFFWKFQRWLGFGKEKNMRIGSEILDLNVTAFITRKSAELLKEEDDDSIDLLRNLLHEKEIQGSKFTDQFLKDIILSFMFAGRENSLAWFFWLVHKNPKAKSKIREELDSVSPRKNGTFFEWEKLNKLVYLHAAIYETLRLYPPVMYEHKEAIHDDVLPSGHFVKEKMQIFIPIYVMARSRSIWGADCEEFKPERWISEEGKLIQHSPYKFLSFSAGPRSCMGKQIALAQMKAFASFLIHNYDYEAIEGHLVIPDHASIILHMKYGFRVRIRKRSTTMN